MEPTAEVHQVAAVWDPAIEMWRGLIENHAPGYTLDPSLVAAVMLIESAGRPNAVSSAGAVGLMQVMPYHPSRFPNRPAASILHNPDANIAWGCAILRQYIDMFDGCLEKGLGAYYAGSHASRAGRADAVAYAQKVLAVYDRYRQQ